jgi:hypothetical protein
VDGGTAMRLSGRRVFLPNPLLPQRPQFLVRWSIDDTRSETTDSLAPLRKALLPLGVINQLQLLLLLALAPVAWTLGTGIVLLAIFFLFYVLTLTALVLAWRQRIVCRIQGRTFWLLALDALACAPFAVNLTRKITMRHGIAGDPLQFAARHMDPAARDTIRQLMAERVHEEHADAEAAERERRISLLNSRLE